MHAELKVRAGLQVNWRSSRPCTPLPRSPSRLIQSKPLQTNPIQSKPSQANPIQSNPSWTVRCGAVRWGGAGDMMCGVVLRGVVVAATVVAVAAVANCFGLPYARVDARVAIRGHPEFVFSLESGGSRPPPRVPFGEAVPLGSSVGVPGVLTLNFLWLWAPLPDATRGSGVLYLGYPIQTYPIQTLALDPIRLAGAVG